MSKASPISGDVTVWKKYLFLWTLNFSGDETNHYIMLDMMSSKIVRKVTFKQRTSGNGWVMLWGRVSHSRTSEYRSVEVSSCLCVG